MDVGDRVRIVASNNPEVEVGSKGAILSIYGGRAEVRMDGTLDDWVFATEQLEKIVPLPNLRFAQSNPDFPVGSAVWVRLDDGTVAQGAVVRAEPIDTGKGWGIAEVKVNDRVYEGLSGALAKSEQELVTKPNEHPYNATFVSYPPDVQASTGNIEMTRALYDVRYVRSGTPEELLEVQGHLRRMIDEGFSYMFMEKFLIRYGYQDNIIRRAFKNLTGLEPQDVVNINYVCSPGTIPQFNLGWGKAKKGGQWIFIMPMVTWYSVMCQVDDMNRHEVSRHKELSEAIEAAKKLVVKLERWDPPVKDIKREDVVPSELGLQPQMYLKASVQRFCNVLDTTRTLSVRRMILEGAVRNGSLTQQEYGVLMQIYGDSKKDAEKDAMVKRLQEIEEHEMKKPAEDVLSRKSPQERFDEQQMKNQFSTVPAAIVDAIMKELAKRNEALQDFKMKLVHMDYTMNEPSGKENRSDEPDVLNAITTVTVTVDLYDMTLPSGQNSKPAFMVFSVIGDNQVSTRDVCKGADNVQYALSDEGLSTYFRRDRTKPTITTT